MRASLAISAVVLFLSAAGVAQALPFRAAGADSANARAYYTRCPNFRYNGRHKLFRHALSCSIAKRKARHVLKNRTSPTGWRCSIDNLSDGYGACVRGKHAFEFLPV